MGYYIWRGGSWRAVDASRARFVFVRRGELRVAPRRAVLRRLAARALRRAAPLPARPPRPARPARRPSRERERWAPPPPVCCHFAAAPLHMYSCQLQQQQSTTQPNKTEQSLRTEQQNTQLQSEQQNNQLQSEQRINQAQSEQRNNQAQKSSDSSSQDEASACKELMLEYADVNRIKEYLDKHPKVFGAVDSKLFQEDEVYRSTVLFRFQPLVKINRLPPIENYFKNNMNLKEFASNLGLKHIDDVERETKRYKTRNNIDKNFSKYFGKHFFDRGSNKENDGFVGESETDSDSEKSSESERGRPVTQREIDNLLNEPKHLRSNVSEIQISPAARVRERDNHRPMVQVSRKRKRDDDSDFAGNQEGGSGKAGERKRDDSKKAGRFFTKKDRSNLVRSGRVAKPVSFKSGGGREYSSLEDHAIVAWVHNGGRSRLVNGNRVWRHLQLSYGNITGQFRTWQSLRNRYLRHILPALSTLRLDSVMQETLRANAAMGELKLSRKKSMTRRNSIFKDDKVQSAWSRQARSQGRRDASPPPTTKPDDDAQDEAVERATRARRTKPNDDEHSSASDELQPNARLDSNERRNNDIRRLAHRLMRSRTLAGKLNDAAPRERDQHVLQSSDNVLNTNKLSNAPTKVPLSSVNVLKSVENPTNSAIKTRHSASIQSKTATNVPKIENAPLQSPASSPLRSPRTVSALAAAHSSDGLFNANYLRSPRTLGGNLYRSPDKSTGASGKQRLSADKHMSRGAGAAHKRALYNHRAGAL